MDKETEIGNERGLPEQAAAFDGGNRLVVVPLICWRVWIY